MGIGYTAWKVTVTGKDTGIVETNYEWARQYWKQRSRATGLRFRLVGIVLS